MRSFWLIIAVASVVVACASGRGDRDATIKSIEDRPVVIAGDQRIDASREKAIKGYGDFVRSAPGDPRRPEAMRRLGDLGMDEAEARELTAADAAAAQPKARSSGLAAGKAGQGYQSTIKIYQDLLRAYPNYPNNDRVTYQLARAYEAAGDLPKALSTLDVLVQRYPNSPSRDEAEFRRGELLFTLKQYARAEEAYATILKKGRQSDFYERALYMHGWCAFKQSRYDVALNSFFGVLDRKLIGRDNGAPLKDVPGLTRADRELVEDTFRVTSLSLASTEGAEAIPRYTSKAGRYEYEFRIYEELGGLYFKQERIKDAADTYNGFARRHPTHPKAPAVQTRVIEAYTKSGFPSLALETKKEFVTRYGVDSAFRRVNGPAVYGEVEPLVKEHLQDLARHYHATAQKEKKPAAYQEAAQWYRTYLRSFPTDPKAAEMNFLLADMLFEGQRYAEAAREYEKTAYGYPPHAKSAEAAYAVLLAYSKQLKMAPSGVRREIEDKLINASVRFADSHPTDKRVPQVLTDTSEKLYARHAPARATVVARRVVTYRPTPDPALRRTAWTVIAHSEFDMGAFDRSEEGYRQALALTPPKDPARPKLTERLASSVYKQGEQARATGNQKAAIASFMRVGQVAPDSPIRATAEYDAAAIQISQKDWAGATRTLEHFRATYPNHKLQGEVSNKLAVSYLESGNYGKAAAELEVLAVGKKDVNLGREATWQAAELYEKAKQPAKAAKMYAQYVERYPQPFEPAMEARYRLATISKNAGQTSRYDAWLRDIVKADQSGGSARTDRTRYLAASAMLVLAEPTYRAYQDVKLVEPLKKSLKVKKAKMEEALKAYDQAAKYGVAEVATAATYQVAEIYNDFGRALLKSQRPKNLKGEELEQYNVLLEEQAYPFEEKAIGLHEANVRRAKDGIYDEWVKKSFRALGKLRPVRYAKAERGEVIIRAIR